MHAEVLAKVKASVKAPVSPVVKVAPAAEVKEVKAPVQDDDDVPPSERKPKA